MKLKPCKCGASLVDRDLLFDQDGGCYEEIECIECQRRVVMGIDDGPTAAEIWNVVMTGMEVPHVAE